MVGPYHRQRQRARGGTSGKGCGIEGAVVVEHTGDGDRGRGGGEAILHEVGVVVGFV